jgi:2-polyprenyl-3-methyl-5-hydroxy-6-metoxy-1,4-benzoquinol methylase
MEQNLNMKKKIDVVKNYWNERPCNIRHSIKEIGTIEYFNDVESRKYYVEPHIPKFANFNQWENKKVLEIGCGLGTDSINFARNGANLTCVELSDKSLDICKKRFDVFNLNAKFYSSNAESLSKNVPIEKYDLIYSFGVIHHTPNPENVFEEIKNYMDNNTEVRIMMYSKYSWKTLEFFIKYGYKFKFNLKKTIQYYAEAQLNCPVAYVYSKKDIKKLLKDFEIISIEKDHIFPYLIKDYIKYKYNKKFIFKIMPKSFFRFLEKTLGWHMLIKFKKKI